MQVGRCLLMITVEISWSLFVYICLLFSVEISGKSSGGRKAGGYGDGMKTLRLRSKGTATVEVVM